MNSLSRPSPRAITDLTRPGVASARAQGAGFTLIEILLAVSIFGLVLFAVHTVFHSAVRLRNQTTWRLENSTAVENTLDVIRHDLVNTVPSGGTLFGEFQSFPQTSPTTTTIGPSFYTATGHLSDDEPWGRVQRVSYYFSEPTNQVAGFDLYRAVARNLLPVMEEEWDSQWLLGGVTDLHFTYFDGTSWLETWDSSGDPGGLPSAVKVQLLLASADLRRDTRPIEMIIPLSIGNASSATNSPTATEGEP